MKHTDFFAQTRAIKAQEYKELYAAVEAHGGVYQWNPGNGSYPTIAVNVNCIYPHPRDINIYKVSVRENVLDIYGKDKEFGNDVRIKPEEVFAGHLSFIIDYIPSTYTMDDVSSEGYRTSNIPDENMAGPTKKIESADACEDWWNKQSKAQKQMIYNERSES